MNPLPRHRDCCVSSPFAAHLDEGFQLRTIQPRFPSNCRSFATVQRGSFGLTRTSKSNSTNEPVVDLPWRSHLNKGTRLYFYSVREPCPELPEKSICEYHQPTLFPHGPGEIFKSLLYLFLELGSFKKPWALMKWLISWRFRPRCEEPLISEWVQISDGPSLHLRLFRALHHGRASALCWASHVDSETLVQYCKIKPKIKCSEDCRQSQPQVCLMLRASTWF
jgi:hypothetical protein